MKKALRIIAMTGAIISFLSGVILCCIYLEEFIVQMGKAKARLADKINSRNQMDETFELE